MKLLDAHCHLQIRQFDADRDAVLARMREADMGAVLIGTDYSESRDGVALANRHDFLWAAVGLHPTDNSSETFDADTYEVLARDPKVVAIGECGLDYTRAGGTDEEREAQKGRFVVQGELAHKLGKALIIHCRNAHDDMLKILSEKKWQVPTVIHFCTVSGEVARNYLDLDCYLSFPGPVTFTDMYDDSIRLCPLDRLLIETDSPFAAPAPYRGKRNEPVYVVEVARKVAALKGVSVEEISSQTVKNSRTAFGLRG